MSMMTRIGKTTNTNLKGEGSTIAELTALNGANIASASTIIKGEIHAKKKSSDSNSMYNVHISINRLQ